MVYIREANINDSKKIADFIKNIITKNLFYFDYSRENNKNSYKLYDENYVKELILRGDKILIAIEEGDNNIVGISHWDNRDGIYFNEYTVVDPNYGKNGIARIFYNHFLDKNIPVGAEFIVYTPASPNIFKLWYNKGTKIFGFSAAQQYYTSDGKEYSTILGFRPIENKINISVPDYAEEYVKRICLLNSIDCKIRKVKQDLGEVNETKGKVILSDEIKNNYILTGFMFNNGKAIYFFSNRIDPNGVENIKKFFSYFENDPYFLKAKDIILSYIEKIK